MQDHTNKETLISDITRKEVEILIEDGTISGGMLPKLNMLTRTKKRCGKCNNIKWKKLNIRFY